MPYAVRSALWFWLSHKVYEKEHNNGIADVEEVTNIVNGGTEGLKARMAAYKLCEEVFL